MEALIRGSGVKYPSRRRRLLLRELVGRGVFEKGLDFYLVPVYNQLEHMFYLDL